MNGKRAIAQLLKYLGSAGVTHLPKVELSKPAPTPARTKPGKGTGTVSSASDAAVAAVAPPPEVKALIAAVAKSSVAVPIPELRRPARGLLSAEELQPSSASRPDYLPQVHGIMNQSFSGLEEQTATLCMLESLVAGCKRCTELSSKRTQTVFGVGNPNARIMFIGEAPGAEEDARGEPFVGPAGQLLNKIIAASQLKREELYICNILRCRPPGNRNPLPQEAANCREFLDAQIHVVKPEYIVCWGTVAAQNLLGQTKAVGKLRGQFFDYNGIRVMCTYHPSYLLRNPAAKKQVWEDMKFFMHELGVELS